MEGKANWARREQAEERERASNEITRLRAGLDAANALLGKTGYMCPVCNNPVSSADKGCVYCELEEVRKGLTITRHALEEVQSEGRKEDILWIEALQKQLEEAKKEREWHPIETAPYATNVLAWLHLPKNPIASAHVIAQRIFIEEDEPESYGEFRHTVGCWWANGRYYPKGYVTCWMPLPEPPALRSLKSKSSS